MTNIEAKQFTVGIFELIKQSKTINDLENISEKMKIPTKNIMNIDVYPKIEFCISKEEIQSLIDDNIIDDNLYFTDNINSKLTDPVSKLLYATAWKNGDLKKVKHIIRGIIDSQIETSDQDEALVFYQFGKYLSKEKDQPIIDQHVIRAFAIYKSTKNDEIDSLRKINSLNKDHKTLIKEYKAWLTSDELSKELKNQKDYTYYIDKLLFATGKTIKSTKQR